MLIFLQHNQNYSNSYYELTLPIGWEARENKDLVHRDLFITLCRWNKAIMTIEAVPGLFSSMPAVESIPHIWSGMHYRLVVKTLFKQTDDFTIWKVVIRDELSAAQQEQSLQSTDETHYYVILQPDFVFIDITVQQLPDQAERIVNDMLFHG